MIFIFNIYRKFVIFKDMKKNIESILLINRYLISNKDDSRKTKLVRDILTSKVESTLQQLKPNPKTDITTYFNTLTLFSL